MQNMHFVIKKGDESFIDSHSGCLYDSFNQVYTNQKRHNICTFPREITDNTFYKYDVIADGNTAVLNVYEGHYDNGEKWEKIYSAYASTECVGVREEGLCDLDFWHEYFATCYCNRKFYEGNVLYFEMNETMKELRKVFKMELQFNPFIFFSKYRKMKKYNVRHFDESLFNIPMAKINKFVGKEYNGKEINYVLQHEIEIGGDVFFDLKILTGPVTNGIIYIKEKHRIFLTSDYWYSPDGCDIGVLVEKNTYGKVFWNKMNRTHPEMMLDKYNGRYKYQYVLSKGFVPCFEILAKAGYEFVADIMLDRLYADIELDDLYVSSGTTLSSIINIWGKNDKEVFGFKLSKFKNFTKDAYMSNNHYRGYDFCSFISAVKSIINRNEAAIDHFGKIDYEFLQFLRSSIRIDSKTIEYMKRIGFNKVDLYNDYIMMCIKAKMYSGGMYPADLKHEHDVMVSYINQLREAERNITFEKVVSSSDYQSLVYDGEGDVYCILAPRTANDLVNESYKLSHCVRSYISSVSSGKKKVYFLRENHKKSTPLITIEVRDMAVYQARGKCNRDPDKYELNFIKKWALKKDLSTDILNNNY